METTNIIIIVAVVIFILLKRMGQVNAKNAQEILKNGAVLIDVRTSAEYAGGSVEGALNIPLDEIGKRIEEKVKDKNTAILVFCLSGARSAMAKRALISAGYKNVHNLGSFIRAKSIVARANS
jgi:rhodanese-related sulfurtransferase